MTIELDQIETGQPTGLRDQLKAAYAQLEKEDSEPAEKPQKTEEKQISDQPDKGPEVETAKGKEQVAEKQGAHNPDELETGPKSWSKADRQHWQAIPKEAREAILRREQQAYKHITTTGSKIGQLQEQYRDVDEAFKPFEAELKQSGVSKGKVVAELLKEHQYRTSNPKQYIQQLANTLKIDLLTLAMDEDIREDPTVRRQRWELEKERETLASQHAEVRQHQQQQQLEPVRRAVEQWAAEEINGQKLRPHFAEVREAMRQMMPYAESEYPHLGHAELLDMVYDRALQHPSFAHLTAQKTQRAKEAARSIGGRTGVQSSDREPKSIRDAMENAYNEIMNR